MTHAIPLPRAVPSVLAVGAFLKNTVCVTRGDVGPNINLDLVVDALLASYAWTYRLAAWEEADAEAMSAVMDRHIGLLADGFRPAPA